MRLNVRLDSSSSDPRADEWRRPVGPPERTLRTAPSGQTSLLKADGSPLLRWTSPLDALDWLDGQRLPDRRWIGFLSYDLGQWMDEAMPPGRSDLPLMVFSEHRFLTAAAALPQPGDVPVAAGPLKSNFSRIAYLAAVERAIRYIAEGDIFQVNLSQQYCIPRPASPATIYGLIQSRYPAWYAALLEYEDFALVCNSPELFLYTWRADGQTFIETRPIKGTRPIGSGMEQELRHSAKDQAELNMIVDLERNDLGRICQIGTVNVALPRQIERHPTVLHGSATITGMLRDDVGLRQILQATFPGGSITGAPKIRAMQIIRELEPTARGPYCGAIGYLDSDGKMQFNIAIRTMILKDGLVHIPVGGGVVADSVPEEEYAETIVKAAAALRVLGVASPLDEG